jgi:hypothetical protein
MNGSGGRQESSMSPTFLEITIAVIAAVLVFLFALRAVPIVIEELKQYFDRTLDGDEVDERNPHDHERES